MWGCCRGQAGLEMKGKPLWVAEEPPDRKGRCLEAYKSSAWSKEGSLALQGEELLEKRVFKRHAHGP